MGIGDSWGTREELLHPRGPDGRFRKKWQMAAGVIDAISKALSAFNPRTFPSDQAGTQYLQKIAKPNRFRGGSEYGVLSDFIKVGDKMRAGTSDASTQKFQKIMEESSVNLPDDIIASRIAQPSVFGLTPEAIDQDPGGLRDFTGYLLADRGYVSTNLGTPLRKRPGQIEIRYAVPKGSKVTIPAASAGDREVILPPDQEFRVTKVTPDGGGGFYVMAVATPRTPGDTPEPLAGPATSDAPAAPGAPQAPGVPGDVQSDNAPDPRAMVQQPGAPPPRSEPEVTPSIGGGPTPAGPGGPSVAPAPGAPGAPAVDAPAPAVPRIVDLRAAVREANLPVPSRGKRRRDWDQAYYKLASPKPANPDDVLRELDKDIEVHRREMADLAQGGDSDPLLADDVEALEGLRDLIREKYDRLAPEKPKEPATPAAKAPEVPPVPTAPKRRRSAGGTPTAAEREGNARIRRELRESGSRGGASPLSDAERERIKDQADIANRRQAAQDEAANAAIRQTMAPFLEQAGIKESDLGDFDKTGFMVIGGLLRRKRISRAEAARRLRTDRDSPLNKIADALESRARKAAPPAKKAAPAKAAPVKKAAPEAPAAPGDDLDKMLKSELLTEAGRRNVEVRPSWTKDRIKQAIRGEAPAPAKKAAPTPVAKAAKAAVPGAAPGTAAGKITAARLTPGTRILVAAESNGRWLPTNRKTDSLSVEVVRVDRVQGGTTPGGRGTSRARIRVTTRDELGRETATNVSPSQTLLVHEHAPGTPAARAAETKVDGPKATTPVLAPDRKKSLHDAVTEMELNFETGSAKRQVDEIVDDMEAGKLTPEEGVRRLETEIALNKEELADLDRAVREESSQELKRLGAEKQQKLARSIKEQERASAGLRKHFGKEPAVTTDEVVINLTPEQGDALNKATLADLKKAAEGLGIKVTGRTKKQFLDALLKKMAEKELERRGLLEKAPAPKAADGPAKDLPAAKWERVNVSALAEGLGLETAAARERINELQKEFDEEKLTPKKIAEGLRGRAHMVSWGGVVEKSVGIRADNDPDRNEAARVKGDKILDEGRKLRELADRIEKVRRRRPSDKPEPEKPKLSAPEKVEIKQVAELTDIPAETLAKKALAKKKADAPPPRTAQQVADTLATVNSADEVNAILKGHTKAELLDIAKVMDVEVRPSATKAKIIEALSVKAPAAPAAPSGGALTRAQLQEMTVPEIKALEDELEIQRPSLNRDDRIDAILKAQGAAPAPKAAALPTDAPEVEAARKRQADIDQARKIGNVAGEWSEILGLNASPEAMLARLRAAEAREGVDLSRIIQSVENGNMRQAAVRIETMIDNANLVRRGTAGRIQQYHAASDQLMPGETVGPSGRVRVLRPGYTLKRDGEQILLSRPIVVPLDDDEVDVPAPDVDRPKKGLQPGATRATDIKVPAGFEAWFRDGRKKNVVIYDKDRNPVVTVSPISVKVDAEEGGGQEDVQERFYGSLWGQPNTNTGSIRSQADAVKAALDMMKRDQPSKLSTKPILENTWGGRRSEIHFHADGAIGMGLRGLKEDDRRLEVNGDALENVIGRIATDLVTGQITGDEQIDRLRDIAAGLPDGPAKRAVSRMVSDLDAPRREAVKVPDAGQYTGVLQELMNKLLQIPLARGGSRANRQDFNEVDQLLDHIKELRTTRAPSILAEDLRRKLWNKRHESMEGKLAIDRAIEAAIKEMKDMKRQPS